MGNLSDLRENATGQRRNSLPGPLFCDELKPKSSISHSLQGWFLEVFSRIKTCCKMWPGQKGGEHLNRRLISGLPCYCFRVSTRALEGLHASPGGVSTRPLGGSPHVPWRVSTRALGGSPRMGGSPGVPWRVRLPPSSSLILPCGGEET